VPAPAITKTFPRVVTACRWDGVSESVGAGAESSVREIQVSGFKFLVFKAGEFA
jgi:hypothetical protein